LAPLDANFGVAVVSVSRAETELLERCPGVEGAIHCGDELWFSVGMEVILRDQRSLSLSTDTPTL